MEVIKTIFDSVKIVRPVVFCDARGRFVKTYSEKFFRSLPVEGEWIEEFYSLSKRNVVRGMHFQTPPHQHSKIIYCLRGRIHDVVLDLRAGSPTYGQHAVVDLSYENGLIAVIPAGFAHGFCVMSDEAIMQYKVSSSHSPLHDQGIRWDSFGHQWPIESPTVSERDRALPPMSEFVTPFRYA